MHQANLTQVYEKVYERLGATWCVFATHSNTHSNTKLPTGTLQQPSIIRQLVGYRWMHTDGYLGGGYTGVWCYTAVTVLLFYSCRSSMLSTPAGNRNTCGHNCLSTPECACFSVTTQLCEMYTFCSNMSRLASLLSTYRPIAGCMLVCC